MWCAPRGARLVQGSCRVVRGRGLVSGAAADKQEPIAGDDRIVKNTRIVNSRAVSHELVTRTGPCVQVKTLTEARDEAIAEAEAVHRDLAELQDERHLGPHALQVPYT